MRRALALLALALLFACKAEEIDRGPQMAAALASLRAAIQKFHAENGRRPYSLDELVPGYIAAIPNDPVTGKPDWRVIAEEPVAATNDFTSKPQSETQKPTIVDVRSSAAGMDLSGKPWADY